MKRDIIFSYAASVAKLLAPVGVLAGVFVFVGVMSGHVAPTRLLLGGVIAGATGTSSDATGVNTITQVTLTTYNVGPLCSSDAPMRRYYLSLSPAVPATMATISGTGISHTVDLTSTAGISLPASKSGINYHIDVKFPSSLFTLTNLSSSELFATSSCPDLAVAASSTDSTGTTYTESTSTATTSSATIGGTAKSALVKFTESLSDLMCTSGTGSRSVTVSVDHPSAVKSIQIYSHGKLTPTELGTPVTLPVGSYFLMPQLVSGFIPDTSTLNFGVPGECSNITASSTNITVATTTPYVAPTGFILPPDWGEPDHVDHSATLSVVKEGARVDTASGYVYLTVSGVPGDNVRLFLGDESHYRGDLVFAPGVSLAHEANTDRWKAVFNTTHISDGSWRLRAAYLSTENYWVYSDPLPFTVNNHAPDSLEVKPAPPRTTSTRPISHTHEKPSINLVIGNRRVTTKNPTLDREELEARVSTEPAQKVQFLILSTDGAISPAIRELGPGAFDEVLSREDHEVYTRFIDVNLLPTGSYRVFARVHYDGGDTMDSDSWPITVSHLMQVPSSSVAPFGEAKSSADIAALVTPNDRDDILAHVTDPSGCTTQEECAVFCSSTSGAESKCQEFSRANVATSVPDVKAEVRKSQEETRKALGGKIELHIPTTGDNIVVGTTTAMSGVKLITQWKTPDPIVRPSLVDTLPVDVLNFIIDPKSQLSAELPEEVNSIPALQSYCGVVEHIEKCERIVERIAPTASSTLETRAEVVRSFEQKTLDVLDQRVGSRQFIDTSGSGIPDYDKVNIYHTDLKKRDTRGTGMSDGALLLGNGNPGKAAQSPASSAMLVIGQNMAIENPKITGSTQKKLLSVASVATFEKSKDENGKEDAKRVLFKGKAPPNSFVRIFTFSEPIVVTVKADEQGNWSYILDKTLPDGNHTAYAAIADASGRILAKSEPLPFVKVASAVTASGELTPTSVQENGMLSALSPMVIIALVVALAGISLSIVGAVIGLRKSV